MRVCISLKAASLICHPRDTHLHSGSFYLFLIFSSKEILGLPKSIQRTKASEHRPSGARGQFANTTHTLHCPAHPHVVEGILLFWIEGCVCGKMGEGERIEREEERETLAGPA